MSLSKTVNQSLAMLVVIGMAVQLAVISLVFVQGYRANTKLLDFQRAACERGKLDRKSNAAFQTAHKQYIDKVVLAQSVQEDVKRAARDAVEVYQITAADLRSRASIDCNEVFPKEGLFP